MTTAVSGLIKIGKTGSDNFQERMRNLEANGYYNVAGLKRFFAIELEDYADKEKLLHEIFSKHQVAASELFALDIDMARQLLLSFDGKIIFPAKTNKEKDFEEITKIREQDDIQLRIEPANNGTNLADQHEVISGRHDVEQKVAVIHNLFENVTRSILVTEKNLVDPTCSMPGIQIVLFTHEDE
jgi:hypothetical protein